MWLGKRNLKARFRLVADLQLQMTKERLVPEADPCFLISFGQT